MSQQPTTPLQSGSMPLFRVAGIRVSVHWSWLLVAYVEISFRNQEYAEPLWNILEYVALFGIVLLHEFGHALACRQVGGKADSIVLWPLGGVAFVAPPPRPGAVLWSIAAGPLVNVALVPLTLAACILSRQLGWPDDYPNLARLVNTLAILNGVLLVFNLMPIYPLDGGQILQALLWFVIGQARSLQVVSVIGFIGAAGLVLLALHWSSWWLGIIAGFIALRAISGYQQAGLLSQRLALPRHQGPVCPSCGLAPLQGNFWKCPSCGTPFDIFEQQAQCPHCHERFDQTGCPECGRHHPLERWYPHGILPPGSKTAGSDERAAFGSDPGGDRPW
jgi:Zn-dependent protease